MKRPVTVGLVVLIGACLTTACDDASTASPSGAVQSVEISRVERAAEEYRLAKPPIGLLQSTSEGALVQVRFRMNRALPQDQQGARAEVLIGEAGTDSPPRAFANKRHHCYAAVVGNDFDEPVLRGANVGTTVPLLVRVRRRGRRSTIRAAMRLRSGKSSVSSLNCGSRLR